MRYFVQGPNNKVIGSNYAKHIDLRQTTSPLVEKHTHQYPLQVLTYMLKIKR